MQSNVVYLFVRQKSDGEKFPKTESLLTQARMMYREEVQGSKGTVPDIARTEKGKPYFVIKGTKDTVECSVTHTGNLWLCAISAQRVGLDAETRKDVDVSKTAKRFFTEEEQAYLASVPEAQRKKAFFAIWCRKEAVVKFAGSSLGFGLSHYSTVKEYRMRESLFPEVLPEKTERTAFLHDMEEELVTYITTETTVVLATSERSFKVCVRRLK